MDALHLGSAVALTYLAAATCFIVGLKRLGSPVTARSGNAIAIAGMALAISAALLSPGLGNRALILTGLAVGVLLAAVGARLVPVTDMPQAVALLNGLGGGAAAIVSLADYLQAVRSAEHLQRSASITILVGSLVGSISLSGSLVAFGKLQGLLRDKPVTFPLQKALNLALFVGSVVAALLVLSGAGLPYLTILIGCALALGVFVVLPIGGADMPVVISLLNSCTGLAAAATGFALGNDALIIAGTLVGASGAILTQLMCKAMNRSLVNVLFGAFGGAPAAAAGAETGPAKSRSVRKVAPEDVAVLLANCRSLIIVPGYGMAVARAQQAARELAELVAKNGTVVKYAIHPVAGRMPGHMNVLLAEADVPYTQLFDLEEINPEFASCDVALVVGANDVVNPAARTDRNSPIYGMPILDVDRARHVVVIKRSLNPGFAGIENELYHDPKTLMLFDDARSALTKITQELRGMSA